MTWHQFPSDASHAFPPGQSPWTVSYCGRVTAERIRLDGFPEMDGVRCRECEHRVKVEEARKNELL